MEFQTVEELDKYISTLTRGAFTTLDMEVMVPEVKKLQKGDIYVEIGVDRGKSLLAAILTAVEGVRIFGVDISSTSELYDLLSAFPNVKFLHCHSDKAAGMWTAGKVSLIHIDGDHSYQGCHTDIESWYPYMKENGVMLFHDCDETSPGVMWAVSEFVHTHKLRSFQLFKRTDKNTSMCRIEL